MSNVHQVLGGLVVLLNLAAGLWCLVVWQGWTTPGRVFEQVLALSHTVIIGQALLGLLLLSGQLRAPAELHYVYGLVPAVLVVFGYSSRTDEPKRNQLVFGIVGILAAALGSRAFMTGMGWG